MSLCTHTHTLSLSLRFFVRAHIKKKQTPKTKKKRAMYARLTDADRALFRTAVTDIVDSAFTMGYYAETIVVVHADGTYHCLAVYGYDDYGTGEHLTKVGRYSAANVPPQTWLPRPMAEKRGRSMAAYESWPLSIVLDDWASLDRAPGFVRWSGTSASLSGGASASGLRATVPRIAADQESGACVLYAAGISLAASFRAEKPSLSDGVIAEKPRLSDGVIAGIVCGSILLIAAIALAASRHSPPRGLAARLKSGMEPRR